MEPCETTNEPETDETICHNCYWCWRFFNCLYHWMMIPIHEKLDVQSAHWKYVDAQDGCWRYKTEEVAIIALSNALPNPRTVVIKALDTVITFGTVRAARRSIYHASVTVFYFHGHTIDQNLLDPWKLKSVWSWSIMRKLFHRWMWVPWYNTWILRWGQEEQ